MKTIGVILAGGMGGRFGSNIPKQYMSLNGKLVIQYVINAFEESECFDKIIIVGEYASIKHEIVKGGKTRNESIQNALKACPVDTDCVLFHDAARPFIKAEDLKQYIDALKDNKVAVTSVKITDALCYSKSQWSANRNDYTLIQTPEAFHYWNLVKSFNKDNNLTAICEHVADVPWKLIELSHQNMKITYAQDLYIAEQLMKYKEVIRRTSDVKDKDILVMGGTGGIGSAVVTQLKESGANVFSYGSKNCNLAAPLRCLPDWRKYDCLIYSAGAYANDSEGLCDNYDKIMNVNFASIVYLIENIEKLLKPNGSIILLGSTAAAFGRPGISLYSASKAALNCFVEAQAPALAKKGFRINVICPAKVATPLQTHINPNANQKEMIQPEDLAKIIIGYIDIDKTGEIVYVKVGMEGKND